MYETPQHRQPLSKQPVILLLVCFVMQFITNLSAVTSIFQFPTNFAYCDCRQMTFHNLLRDSMFQDINPWVYDYVDNTISVRPKFMVVLLPTLLSIRPCDRWKGNYAYRTKKLSHSSESTYVSCDQLAQASKTETLDLCQLLGPSQAIRKFLISLPQSKFSKIN